MKLIKTVDAEGAVLCHDITQIIKGVTKDAVFRKGHIVTKEDIPVLLSVGKDQLYVWKRKRACFMKMTLQKSFVPCAKGNTWSVPRQKKERSSFLQPAMVY